jgi:hypothetical protein
MDTWLPFAIVVVLLLAGIAVLVMRVVRNRSEPHDADDDAMRREGSDAYYRSQRDQTDLPPGIRRPGTGGDNRP